MTKEQIIEKITNPTTKWGEYFQRFYENQPDLFWKFYELNTDNEVDTSTGSEFQILGKQVEMQMFNFCLLYTSRCV